MTATPAPTALRAKLLLHRPVLGPVIAQLSDTDLYTITTAITDLVTVPATSAGRLYSSTPDDYYRKKQAQQNKQRAAVIAARETRKQQQRNAINNLFGIE